MAPGKATANVWQPLQHDLNHSKGKNTLLVLSNN